MVHRQLGPLLRQGTLVCREWGAPVALGVEVLSDPSSEHFGPLDDFWIGHGRRAEGKDRVFHNWPREG